MIEELSVRLKVAKDGTVSESDGFAEAAILGFAHTVNRLACMAGVPILRGGLDDFSLVRHDGCSHPLSPWATL